MAASIAARKEQLLGAQLPFVSVILVTGNVLAKGPAGSKTIKRISTLRTLHIGYASFSGSPRDERGVLARRWEYATQKWHHTPMFLPCTRISFPMTLGGLLVALSLLGACGEAHRPTGIGTRAVVTGIDGAD